MWKEDLQDFNSRVIEFYQNVENNFLQMINQNKSTEKKCQQDDIAAYIDGELLPREELKLESHFAVCEDCRLKLNEQKKLLCALDFVLEQQFEIEIPADFTKVVMANAENKVSGLRRPQERIKAFAICVSLFLLTILGLGNETEPVFKAFWKFGDQFMAVFGFAAHLIYDISIGTIIILRSLSHHFLVNSALTVFVITGCLFILMLGFLRLLTGFNRT